MSAMPTPFRLARLLRLRTQLREQAQRELGVRQAALAALDGAIAAARADEDAARADAGGAVARGASGRAVALAFGYAEAQAARVLALAARRVTAAAAVEEQRRRVIARRREEEQLARLQARARERARAAEAHAEALFLDELALGRRAGER